MTVDCNLSIIKWKDTDCTFECGAFACTVMADKAEDLTRLNM